ncbi:uncharacterized protein LTR77_004534 [Saxophila tyrrhenica]|uniref:Uncharacterized protein n=1 Tax=Saxophila tyrrhenica TaxID=1690608 RepID=A0AAV9PDQ4_9PEZI|nr:hypothetical protein LTR77_004534 [Saxophila tyrrhenica]
MAPKTCTNCKEATCSGCRKPDRVYKPFNENVYKLNLRALVDYSVYRSSDERSNDKVAQTIAPQMLNGREPPDLELLVHLAPSLADIEKAVNTTAEHVKGVFFEVYMNAPEEVSVRAYGLWVKWKAENVFPEDLRLIPGTSREAAAKEYPEALRFFSGCLQEVALACQWAKHLKQHLWEAERAEDDPYFLGLLEKDQRRMFAREEYGINIDCPQWDAAGEIASAVIKGKKPPSLRLLKDIQPDTVTLSWAFNTALVSMNGTIMKVQRGDGDSKPPNWILSRTYKMTSHWDCIMVMFENSKMIWKAAETGEELSLFAACLNDLAECLSFWSKREYGLWPSEPAQPKPKVKLSATGKTKHTDKFVENNGKEREIPKTIDDFSLDMLMDLDLLGLDGLSISNGSAVSKWRAKYSDGEMIGLRYGVRPNMEGDVETDLARKVAHKVTKDGLQHPSMSMLEVLDASADDLADGVEIGSDWIVKSCDSMRKAQGESVGEGFLKDFRKYDARSSGGYLSDRKASKEKNREYFFECMQDAALVWNWVNPNPEKKDPRFDFTKKMTKE